MSTPYLYDHTQHADLPTQSTVSLRDDHVPAILKLVVCSRVLLPHGRRNAEHSELSTLAIFPAASAQAASIHACTPCINFTLYGLNAHLQIPYPCESTLSRLSATITARRICILILSDGQYETETKLIKPSIKPSSLISCAKACL